eukprot:scaffold3662_cov94-Alexandrium_tamarense.AAC.1
MLRHVLTPFLVTLKLKDYVLGPCMNTITNHFENKNAGCDAGEVKSINVTLGDNDPTTCIEGENISVNPVLFVEANTERFDPAIWVAQDPDCVPASSNPQDSCALVGGFCALEVLGPEDEAENSNIGQYDFSGGNDTCYDIKSSGNYKFALQKNITVPCRGVENFVELGVCFSWRVQGSDENCEEIGAWPGPLSKCSIEIEIDIIRPPTPHPTSVSTNSSQAKEFGLQAMKILIFAYILILKVADPEDRTRNSGMGT